MQSLPQTQSEAGTRDGSGARDCDLPYVFGRRPMSNATGPFSTHQFARLLVLRRRVQAGLFAADDFAKWSMSAQPVNQPPD